MVDLGGGTKLGQPVAWDGYPLAFSPDGRLAAAASSVDNAVALIDVGTAQVVHELRTPQSDPPTLAAFSPDGASVAVGYAPTAGESAEIEIFSTADGQSERLLTLSGVPFIGGPAAWSPDGRVIAGAGMRHDLIRVDATSGERLDDLPLPGLDIVDHVSYDPDGRLFVAGEPGYAFVFDRAGKTIKAYPLPDHTYMTGAWGPDGTLVLPDYRNGEIRVVDPLTDLQTGAVYVGPAGFTDVAVGPDGRGELRGVSGSAANVISLWDVDSGQAIGEPIEASATSPGNPIVTFNTALTTDAENHRMILWDLDPAAWRVRAVRPRDATSLATSGRTSSPRASRTTLTCPQYDPGT